MQIGYQINMRRDTKVVKEYVDGNFQFEDEDHLLQSD